MSLIVSTFVSITCRQIQLADLLTAYTFSIHDKDSKTFASHAGYPACAFGLQG